MINRYCTLVALLTASFPAVASDQHGREMLEALAAQHAKAHGVPVGLVHRVIIRKSRYNPSVISRGNYGLMQIRHATARGMGYNGPASGYWTRISISPTRCHTLRMHTEWRDAIRIVRLRSTRAATTTMPSARGCWVLSRGARSSPFSPKPTLRQHRQTRWKRPFLRSSLLRHKVFSPWRLQALTRHRHRLRSVGIDERHRSEPKAL